MHTIFWLQSLKGRELGRPSRRWENNIKRDLSERVGGCGLDAFGTG